MEDPWLWIDEDTPRGRELLLSAYSSRRPGWVTGLGRYDEDRNKWDWPFEFPPTKWMLQPSGKAIEIDETRRVTAP